TNPVDTTAPVGQDAFRACLETVAADDGIDAVLTVTVPTAIADLTQAVCSSRVAKPLAAAALDQRETVRLLHSDNYHAGQRAVPSAVPVYAFPEGPAGAWGHAARDRAWRGRPHGGVPEFSGLRTGDARAQVTAFLRANPEGGWLPGQAARDLLACYQVPLVPARMAADEAEAVRAAAGFGGPGVLKAEAAGRVHKTEAGGVADRRAV